jgi:hypothetical protein
MPAETTPPPLSIPQPVPRTAPTAIWSLVLGNLFVFLRLALYRDSRGHLRPHRALENSEIWRRTWRKGNRHRGLILGYIALVLGAMGIPLLVSMIQSDRERIHRLATERKEIASDDAKARVTVPGLWTKLPGLNQQASLQVGSKRKEVYLIVITDTKADLDNLTLEKHHYLTRDRMLQKMQNASATEPVSLTIDGHPALQDELTGTEKGTKVVFLHTTIDDGDHFQQILAWTLKSRWRDQNQLLREATESFRSEK